MLRDLAIVPTDKTPEEVTIDEFMIPREHIIISLKDIFERASQLLINFNRVDHAECGLFLMGKCYIDFSKKYYTKEQDQMYAVDFADNNTMLRLCSGKYALYIEQHDQQGEHIKWKLEYDNRAVQHITLNGYPGVVNTRRVIQFALRTTYYALAHLIERGGTNSLRIKEKMLAYLPDDPETEHPEEFFTKNPDCQTFFNWVVEKIAPMVKGNELCCYTCTQKNNALLITRYDDFRVIEWSYFQFTKDTRPVIEALVLVI